LDEPSIEPTRITKIDETLAPRLPLKSFPAGHGPAAATIVQLGYGKMQMLVYCGCPKKLRSE
jgi:hypothetical protein